MNIRTNPKPAPSAADVAQWRMAAKTAGLSATLADCLASNCADVSMAANSPFLTAVKNLGDYVAAVITDPGAAETQADASIKAALASATTPEEALAAVMAEGSRWWKMAGGDDKPTQRANVGYSYDSPRAVAEKAGDALAAQIGARMGLDLQPTKGRQMAHMSLGEMAMACARAAGMRPVNAADAIMSAGWHFGSDFPLAVEAGLQGVLAKGFEVAQPAIVQAAAQETAMDYRQRNSVSLTGSGKPALVLEGAEIPGVTINEKGELAPRPDDYGARFALTRQAMVNDANALGLLADVAAKMVQGATGRFRDILLAPLVANSGLGQTMLDGNPLFHSSHGNVAGTAAAITLASLNAGQTAMRRQKDSQGTLWGLEPAILLVAPEKEMEARQAVASIYAATIGTANPFTGALRVVVEPGLTAANAWYLVADPAKARGLVYAWLDGATGPRVETQQAWSTLGMEFRLTMAVGAAFTETASWYRNAGA